MSQQINVKMSERVVTIISTGPLGPPGLVGPEGPEGPQGPSGIHVGTEPPQDTTILWYDTN